MAGCYKIVLSVAVVTVLVVRCKATAGCQPGTIRVEASNGQSFTCEPCAEGTFADKADLIKCDNCKYIPNDDPYLKVVSPCQPDHDTVVVCRDSGYFHKKDQSTCQRCTRCEDFNLFTAQACSGDTDAVCCPKPDMEVKDGRCFINSSKGDNNNRTNNVESTLYCSVKEYLARHRVESGESKDVYLPCPENTSNYNTHHRKHTCEERCVEIEAAHIKERSLFCWDDERTLGKSCTRNERVVCALAEDKETLGKKVFYVATVFITITSPFLLTVCFHPAWTSLLRSLLMGVCRLGGRRRN